MTTDLKKIAASEMSIEQIDGLISSHSSFQVVGVDDIGELVKKLEERIDVKGLKCRIYTEYRSAGLAAGTLFGVGAAVAAGIAVHNLATWNPDYEIGKNKLNSSVTVTYKKEEE